MPYPPPAWMFLTQKSGRAILKITAGNTHYENHNYAELKRLVGRLYDYNHVSPIIAAYTRKGTHPEDNSSELNRTTNCWSMPLSQRVAATT